MRLFGALELLVGGAPVAADYRTGPLLLAWLVLHRERSFTRSELAELLWPEAPPDAGRRRLREVLFRLRRALGEDERESPIVVADRDHVALGKAPALDVDVWALDANVAGTTSHDHRRLTSCPSCLDALDRAQALYRGGLLDQETLPEGAFADRVATLRRDCERSVLEALHALGVHALETREWARARSLATRIDALAPDSEQALRLRMRALAGEGRRVEALSAYDAHAARLDANGDPGPDDETEELYQNIKHEETAPVEALGGPALELPAPATSLIGRRAELGRVDELLARTDVRLVTLTGMGGAGKTRLAIEAAGRAGRSFPDGVWFVAAESTSSARELALAIAAAVRCPRTAARSPEEQLSSWLRARELCLVLDNLEQNAAAAELVSALLAGAPKLRVLATSRARLALRAEHLVPLEGLERDAAVELWCERARQLRPDLALDRAVVAEICELVGDLPLALELTSARVLDDELSTIRRVAAAAGSDAADASAFADLPPRQRSLASLLASSIERLSERDRSALLRLSVFRGPFQAEAAHAVCQVDETTVERLALLSLLGRRDAQRLAMHPLIAAYARARAVPSPEARRAHRRWFLARLDLVAPTSSWVLERDDIRAAWQSAVDDADLEEQARSAYALERRLSSLGWSPDAHACFSRALEALPASTDHPAKRRVLACAGISAYRTTLQREAEEQLEQAAGLARAAGDERDAAMALGWLGFAVRNGGHPQRSLGPLEQAVQSFERVGDHQAAIFARYVHATALYESGDVRAAERALSELVTQLRDLGEVEREGYARSVLGLCQVLLGDARSGLAQLYAAARLHRRLAVAALSDTLNALACACLLAGRPADAVRHAEGARAGYVERGFLQGAASACAWRAMGMALLETDSADDAARASIEAALRADTPRALLEAALALAYHLSTRDLPATLTLCATVEAHPEPIAELAALLAQLRARLPRARSTPPAPLSDSGLRETLAARI